MPQEVFAEVHELERMFDEMAGFTPTLQGRGEAGVRSAQQAETLVRMSSPRLRDRALLIEHQVAELGDLCFQLMQEKDGNQYTASDGQEFYLTTLPEDYTVTVDAHSGSPVFVEDAKRDALVMLAHKVIDEEDYIDLTSPPMAPTLKKRLRDRKAAQAKFMAEHPEMMHHGHKKKG
jgi:hypothetical protein